MGGLRWHEVNGFISLSPTMGVRIIAQEHKSAIILLFVARHDDAYAWSATKRLVGDLDSYEVISIPVREKEVATPLIEGYGLEIATRAASIGLDSGALAAVSQAIDEDDLLAIIESMSEYVQDAILAVASGQLPARLNKEPTVITIGSDDDLMRALSLPLSNWRTFLHPAQRSIVDERREHLLAIMGAPGTGKSVVCVHRAVGLSREILDSEVVLLLTYSRGLVNDLQDAVKFVDPYNKFKVRVHTLDQIRNSKSSVSIDCDDGGVFLTVNESIFRVQHIVVDEFQDSSNSFSEFLTEVIDGGMCSSITVALDPNQSIFMAANRSPIWKIIDKCNLKYLNNCYRLTKQLLSGSYDLLSQIHEYGQSIGEATYAVTMPRARLSGPKLTLIPSDSDDELLKNAKTALNSLVKRYGGQGVACIYVQHYNPHFAKSGKVDEVERKILADETLGAYHEFAPKCKGREFFATVLVVPESYLSSEKQGQGRICRLNTLYVGLTRARNETIVVYRKTSPCAQFLDCLN
jgi:hypothetical protein